MTNARNNNRRNPQRRARPRRPLTKTQIQSRRPERRQRDTWPRRFLAWIVTANKAVLAAIGAGLLGAITAAVLGVPHLLAASVRGSPPPLTVAGAPSPNNAPPANPGDLTGTFVVPGTPHPAHTLSTDQLSALLQDAADANSTSGEYVLQAQPDQTAVITAIHTILVKRVPAHRGTIIEAVGASAPSGGLPIYLLSVNLDAANPTPTVQIENTNAAGQTTWVHDLQAIVTNGSPILIHFNVTTSKYDVIWKFRIDYTVNGQLHTDWLQKGSQPFHTEAERPDDPALTFTIHQDGILWTAESGTPGH